MFTAKKNAHAQFESSLAELQYWFTLKAAHLSHNELVTLFLALALQKVLFYCLLRSSELKTGKISLSSPLSRQWRRGSGRKQTEQMLWNGKSDHFTSHLFCLPIYCCKAGVQGSRCLAKHEGAVPPSLWGWLSLLSLLMHRHDSCLISWSC